MYKMVWVQGPYNVCILYWHNKLEKQLTLMDCEYEDSLTMEEGYGLI